MKEKFKNIVGVDDYARPFLKRNTQKGITLVALVITIIVLLILAMVSISIVMNQGIITKSQTAKEKHQSSAEEEAINIGYSEYLTKKYNGETAELEVANATSTPIENGWKISFDNGKVYTLSNEGEIKEESENGNTPEDELGEWWLPTEEEKTEMYEHFLMIADNDMGSDPGSVQSYIEGDLTSQKYEFILFGTSSDQEQKTYLYSISGEQIGENNVVSNQWYCETVKMKENGWDLENATFEEYNGPCPISKDLFTQIYCESYLDRIIASFK